VLFNVKTSIILIALVGGRIMFRKRIKDKQAFGDQKEVITVTLRGLQDIDMICHTIDKGNIVILGVKHLARLDMIRLKRSIQQLKSHVISIGGDIVALGKEFVVIVPPSMKLSFIKHYLEESLEEDMNPPDTPSEVGYI
jgi:SepF-like predicted cell division protein (DUF552 family)